MIDNIVWLVPKALPISHFEKLILLCDLYTWIAIFIAYFIISVLFYFFAITIPEIKYYKNIANCFVNCFLNLLSAPVAVLPTTNPLKFLFVTWALFNIVWNNVFNGNLMFMLNHDILHKQIETTEDLMKSKLPIGLFKEMGDSFANGNKFDRYIFENYVLCDISGACVVKVATTGKFVAASLRRSLTTMFFLSESGIPLLYVFKENIRISLLTFYVTKGFPLYPQIDKLLYQMTAYGFVNYFEEKSEYYYQLQYGRNLTKIPLISSRALTFKNVGIIFIFMALGHCLAAVIFFIEWTRTRQLRH